MILAAAVSLAASLALTALVRTFARRWGIVDRPDGRRKLHGRPVPLLGGVAVYGAIALGLFAIRLLPGGAATPEFINLSTAWLIAAGCVCFVGGGDDWFDLPSRLKLVLQIVSVLPIVALGHYVDRIVAFGCPIELGWLGVPLTVVWLVGCINALNLIDGMDGLASTVGLATAAMMGVIAASEGHPHVAIMATVLSASLLGFLMYNLPPASIFLGDSGSMVIGLSVGLLGIQGSLKTSATLGITAPAVVMTLPMFDIVAALVRRKMTGRRFDSPDRLHIHHRLLDRGWTPWQVLCLLGAVCLTTGAAATAATILRRDILAWIIAMSLIVLMIRLRLFGYEEFALVKGMIVRTVKSATMPGVGWTRQSRPHGPGVLETVVSADGARQNGPRSRLPIADAQIPNPLLWDLLLSNVRQWHICRVEFAVSQAGRFRRVRWSDPRVLPTVDCRWSHAVSLPAGHGEICKLTVAGEESIVAAGDLAALTAMLIAFGDQFAAHPEMIFGPSATTAEPMAAPERRKAA